MGARYDGDNLGILRRYLEDESVELVYLDPPLNDGAHGVTRLTRTHGARPVEQKKGADHGIDGRIFIRDDPKAAKPEQIVIQVKGGRTGVKDVRDREKAANGTLISFQPPTGPSWPPEPRDPGIQPIPSNRRKEQCPWKT